MRARIIQNYIYIQMIQMIKTFSTWCELSLFSPLLGKALTIPNKSVRKWTKLTAPTSGWPKERSTRCNKWACSLISQSYMISTIISFLCKIISLKKGKECIGLLRQLKQTFISKLPNSILFFTNCFSIFVKHLSEWSNLLK